MNDKLTSGKIDFNRFSKAQIRALGLIAINVDPPGVSKRTFKSLEELGLIVPHEEKIPFPPLGQMTVIHYEMPIWAHIQWCQWCSEQPGIDDLDGPDETQVVCES